MLAANPKTIVVEMNAGPLAIPTIAEKAPAILEAWWAGEEGGNAIADVIFGNVNPGGKMPLTVYASDDQVPPQDEYDISKGFTYMYLKGKPLFAFGHGLSYTTFKYDNLKLADKKLSDEGTITATLDVTNTGDSRRRRSGAALLPPTASFRRPSGQRTPRLPANHPGPW